MNGQSGGFRVVVLTLMVATLVGCSAHQSTRLTITGAWARTTPTGAANGVVYLTLDSPIADSLTSVSVPPDVASKAEMHSSMTTSGEGSMANMPNMASSSDMSTMESLSVIELPPHQRVSLLPGGRHIMLTGLVAPLTAGSSFDVVLHLDRQGPRKVHVVVSDNPPSGI